MFNAPGIVLPRCGACPVPFAFAFPLALEFPFPFWVPLDLAALAQVREQNGWVAFPSVYFGRTLQCYKNISGVSHTLVRSAISDVESGTSQFIAAELAFAQALEQKLCNTPEVGSSHLGCKWQFYER